MKTLKLGNTILLIIVCMMLESCITLQQPLPNSLWGNWTFEEAGFLNKQSNSQLEPYQNICHKEGDRLGFSSDHKMKLRWYDESCMIYEYFIGHYQVNGKILTVDLAESHSYQDRPFPPITKFRIMQIDATTLKLEEIPDGSRRNRDRARPGFEPLIFIFKKLD
ncbi:MAG: hypothetical protein ACTH5N_04750 [Psychroflexus halocasei]